MNLLRLHGYPAWGGLLLTMVFLGCSATHPVPSPGENVYEAEQMQEFVTETRTPAHFEGEDEYVIGIGDRMDIVFLFHNNLTTRELLVRRDGMVSLPYVDDHVAAGLTPMTLDSLLTNRYSRILRDPNLSVIITEPAAQRVYVLGQVVSPGGYEFDSELSVLQAVARSGGFEEGAMADHAILIRRHGVDRIVGIEIDLKAIMAGAAIENDIRLRNYDILYVPQTRLHSTAEFATTFQQIINLPVDLVWKTWQIRNLQVSYEFWQRAIARPNTP